MFRNDPSSTTKTGSRMSHLHDRLCQLAAKAGWVGTGLMLPLFLWAGWTLAASANLAPELSDTGYYLLMHRSNADVIAQISGFGSIAYAFLGDLDVEATRLIHIALVFMAPAAFIWITHGNSESRPSLGTRIAASLIAGLGGWVYFKWMLLDPNYNSMAIIFLFSSFACLWVLATQFSGPKAPKKVWLFGAGAGSAASIFALGFVKVTSGIFFCASFLPVFIVYLLWRNNLGWPAFWQTAVFAILGGFSGVALFIIFLWIRVISPLDLIHRAFAGLEYISVLGQHSIALPALARNANYLFDVLVHGLKNVILPVLLVFATFALMRFLQKGSLVRWISYTGTLLSALAILYVFLPSWENLRTTTTNLWAFTIVISLLVLVFFNNQEQIKTSLFSIAIVWSPLILVFGSFAGWPTHGVMFCGSLLVFFSFIAMQYPELRFQMLVYGCVLAPILLFSSLQEATNKPYRMGEPTISANIEIRLKDQQFRATPSLAATYTVVKELETKLQAEYGSQRPMLIDMTGRAPTLIWALSMHVPPAAWLISGYSGSNGVLSWALEQVPASRIKNAWILVDRPRMDGKRFGFSMQTLAAQLSRSGLRFPQDYETVASVPIAYMGMHADLYRPRRNK